MQLSVIQTAEPVTKIKPMTSKSDIVQDAANELAISHGFTNGPRACDIADAEIVCQVIFQHVVEALFEGRRK